MHIGHKVHAEATVVAAELIKQNDVKPWNVSDALGTPVNDRWAFVLEIRPPSAAPFRAEVEQKIPTLYTKPGPGDTVRVAYPEKHPDKAEMLLDNDPRYDFYLRQRQREQEEKAGETQKRAALDAALHAHPGTPPPAS